MLLLLRPADAFAAEEIGLVALPVLSNAAVH